MDKNSALFATVLTGLTMSILEKKDNAPKENRKLTIPEEEIGNENMYSCFLIILLVVISGSLSYYSTFFISDLSGFDHCIFIAFLLIAFFIGFVFLFYKLYKKTFGREDTIANEPEMIIPIRFRYLDFTIAGQTSKNLPKYFYDQYKYLGADIVCALEEYLCAIGKELVFDKTNLEIKAEDVELIDKLKKLKDDASRAKYDGDFNGYKRGTEILIKWLTPYQFESKDPDSYFTDINDIAENDIITFSRALLEMLFHWQKKIMYYQYYQYHFDKQHYDIEYTSFRKLIVEDNVFGLVDIISALKLFYYSFGAPRIIQIKNPNIFDRPRRAAINDTRTSLLFNPKYIEEGNY